MTIYLLNYPRNGLQRMLKFVWELSNGLQEVKYLLLVFIMYLLVLYIDVT